MKRIEIIANNAVEDDIAEALHEFNAGKKYTKIVGVMGEGRSTPKHGDSVWPEENFIMIIYCEDQEAQAIKTAISRVKQVFPNEGIKLFEMSSSI